MHRSLVLGCLAGIELAFVGLIGYHFIYLQQQREVAEIQTHIAQERAAQQAQVELNTQLLQIEQERAHLPILPETSWLVREATLHSQAAGVELTTITQEAPQVALPYYVRLGITLRFHATYHQLGAFLDALERSDHFIQTDKIEVTGPAEKDGKAAIELVLRTVYLPPAKPGA